MACFKAGTAVFRFGKTEASHEKNMQYDATKANWMRVSVAGLSKAFKMDFEDVLVSADDVYHRTQRT
jgi:hypothetical protein